MQVRTLFKHLWMPVAIVALFIAANAYEQQIFLQLGLSTWHQLRDALPYIFNIGAFLSFAYLVNRIIDVTIWDQIARRVPVPKLLRDTTRLIVYAIAVSAIAAVVFKKDITGIWATGGAVGIIVGFALRNVIVDLFMGLAMNFDRPFEIGNYIQVAGGPSGKVVELNWRTTRILTSEGNMVIVPNGKMGDLIVTNFSKPDETAEMEFIVTLDSEVPADRALRVLTAGAMSVAGTNGVLEEPLPKTRIKGFNGNGVDYKIKYFIDPRMGGPGKARHSIMHAVLDQLHIAGLQLAVNKQETISGREHAPLLDPTSVADRTALLARTDLFRNLEPAAREHLALRMRQHVVKAGEAVVHANDAGDSMFIIFEGLLHVQVPSNDRQSIVRVGKLGAGTFFGEISALTGEPRTATVTAACDSLIFEIQKDAFGSLIAERPDVVQILGDAIAARRVRTAHALAEADASNVAAEERSVARQIVDKIKSFFRTGVPAPPPELNRTTMHPAPAYTGR